jgi:hypothetical protein
MNEGSEKVNLLEGVEFNTSAGSSGNLTFIRLKDLAVDQAIDGIYQGTVKNPRTNKMDVKLTLADGSGAILNAGGNLNYRLGEAKVEVGQPVRIIYKGKSKMAKGQFAGTEAHNFNILTAKQVEG